MKAIAVIPCRAGSVGVPGKNKRPMLGKPLWVWSAEQAIEAGCFESIVVATDDPEVRDYADPRCLLFMRHPLTAGPRAATEAVLLEVILEFEPRLVCVLQATSPLRTAWHIKDAMEKLWWADSVVSVVEDHHVIPGEPRQMRQDMTRVVENGSIYAFHASAFLESMNRLCGKCAHLKMPPWTRYEIDTEDDWKIVELMMRTHLLGAPGVHTR